MAYGCDDLPTMRAFVAAGLGVAILPVPPIRAATHEGLHHVRLTDRGAYRDVGIAWSSEQRMLPAARLFRDHVVQRATVPGQHHLRRVAAGWTRLGT
ncbi:LysR substrate-binding domain-containing protein [Georgenia sp. 10Sc9-8]|uniref:LysR substrate-binding domain-containing protein n=1 Tax=Georgenia halotolerans TaxID=3028317 RepID=A0ABT5TW54_9MICO|nr:LysR substrate-binding domain-containing protein [Georgenia halotolerans]